jgi:hypothetical protein
MKRLLMSAAGLALLGLGACGGAEDPKTMMSAVPPTAMVPAPGMAMVSGHVLTAAQQPVVGAKVSLATVVLGQSNEVATTDDDGAFTLTVPGNSTVSLRADATGYTRALGNSVIIAAGGVTTGFELVMVPADSVDGLSAMVGGARAAEYGMLAVDIISKSGACDPAGGKITIEPAAFGKVFYGKLDDGMPDQTLTAVQPGVMNAAWILGVLPPGIYYRLKFENPGCTMTSMPVDWAGRSYDGRVQMESKAVSRALIFVE